MQAGYPPLLAMALAGMGGLAFQVAHLLWQGKQRNQHWSLERSVLFRESLSIRQYLLLVPLFTIAAFLVYGMTAPLGAYLLGLMPWLPEWFEMRDINMLAGAAMALSSLSVVLNSLRLRMFEA